MFKIKMTCHDLEFGKINKYVDFVDKNFDTLDEAIIAMNECIKDELTTLNENSSNDFKVTYSNENALAIVQCWIGRESEMTESELEEREYYNVTEYNIVYKGTIVDLSLPEKWIN